MDETNDRETAALLRLAAAVAVWQAAFDGVNRLVTEIFSAAMDLPKSASSHPATGLIPPHPAACAALALANRLARDRTDGSRIMRVIVRPHEWETCSSCNGHGHAMEMLYTWPNPDYDPLTLCLECEGHCVVRRDP